MANLATQPTQAPRFSQSFFSDQPAHFRKWALAVLLLAALLFLLRLGWRSVWGSEGRWAEITREMQLTGNYFWPTINGEPYYEKPLPSYWLVAASAYLTGNLDEFAVRLPSALAGLLGVALLIVLTRQLYDGRMAVLAALILATCFSYVFWSRVASADIETVTGVLAAVTLYFRNRERPNGWWTVGLWIIMALTSLTKGLQGFALPLFIISVHSLLADGWRNLREKVLHGRLKERLAWLISRGSWFFNRKTFVAVGIAGVVYVSPFAISAAQMDSNLGLYMVFHENLVRFFEPFDHKEPIYLYTYALFKLMAPWCVFLPAALVHMHFKPTDKNDRFVLAFFWATFIFFTLSGSRRDYYLLPILPAAAIIVARLFTTAEAEWVRSVRVLAKAGYIVLFVSVVVTFIAVALVFFLPAVRPAPLKAIWTAVEGIAGVGFWTFLVALIVTVFPFLNWRPETLAVSTSIMAYACWLFVFVYAFPNGEAFRMEKAFAQSVLEELKGDLNRLVLFNYNKDRSTTDLIFYLSATKPIPEYLETADLEDHIKNNPGTWVIASEKHVPKIPFNVSVVLKVEKLAWSSSDLQHRYVLIRVNGEAEKNKEPKN